jgi:membrane protease YdiL (CAAX protease family)
MKGNFLENATLGTNKWWQYVLSILSAVAGIAVVNMSISQVLPRIKSLFPYNDFGKNLFTFSLVLLIFGVAVIAFLVTARKLHQRSKMSFISNQDKFNRKSYFIGFVTWGTLLFIGLVISDYQKFEVFRENFNLVHFLTLFLFGFIAIGVQSFFEELVLRGYLLQGLHLRIKNIAMLIIINGLIFGFLHFGYGIESFLSSLFFGVAFAIIVILQNRIEFVSGAHNANNLLLSLVFLDLSEATSEKFTWAINWVDFSIHVIALLILVGLVYKIFRKTEWD